MNSIIVQAAQWTFLHSLWQGLAIGAIYGIFLSLAKTRPQIRYLTGCLALLLIVGAAAKTYHSKYHSLAKEAQAAATPPPVVYKHAALTFSQCQSCHTLVDGLPADIADSNMAPPGSPVATHIPNKNSSSTTMGVCIWLTGVTFLTLRLAVSHATVQRLRKSHSSSPGSSILASLERISGQIGVKSSVQIFRSSTVPTPTVIGWLRPVILLPAVSIAGLSRNQLDSVLAHELAHIRRRDYPVNFLQHILEIILFFHPAVWWISSTIRKEREFCCDDIAANMSQSVVEYARALTTLENLRDHQSASLGMAANGGALLIRIKRLGGHEISRSRSLAIASVLMLTAALSIPLSVLPIHAKAPEAGPPPAHLEILPLSSSEAENGIRHLLSKNSETHIPYEDFSNLAISLNDSALQKMIGELSFDKDEGQKSLAQKALIAEQTNRKVSGVSSQQIGSRSIPGGCIPGTISLIDSPTLKEK